MKKLVALITALLLVSLCFTSCFIFNPDKDDDTQNGENTGNTDQGSNNENTDQGGNNNTNPGGDNNNEQGGNDETKCNHNVVVDAEVKPTCTETGLTEGKHCSLCNEVIVAQETVPAQHTYGEWEKVTEGTCLIPGEKTRVCSICEDVETVKTADFAHNFVKNEENNLFFCEYCGGMIFRGHLYVAFENQMNWFDAYKYCDSLGGYLVTITSADEQAAINKLIETRTLPDLVEFYYWTGLYRTSPSIWKWITGEEYDYVNWSSNEPDSEDEQWFMAIATTHVASANSHAKPGEWEDVSHGAGDDAEGLMCEWELDVECTEHIFTEWKITEENSCYTEGNKYRFCTYCGYEESEVIPHLEHNFLPDETTGISYCEYCSAGLYNGHIYMIFTQKLAWFDAYSYCDKLGGHLVTITSTEENDAVKAIMDKNSHNTKTWTGAYNDGNNWYWVTDEAFEYTNWASNQPNNADGLDWIALITSNAMKWNDYSPLEKVTFICEWEVE